MLLLQLASPSAEIAPAPALQYFRYSRAVSVPLIASGQTCATLDAAIFAHAASQSLDDLRLYTNGEKEVPFTITESGSARVSEEQAEVRNAVTRDGNVMFDLSMPNRPYTAVQLELNAKNFIANARVTGSNGSEAPVVLGTFALFDFSSQHLSRSTTLSLQESSFHVLHVTLHFTATPGAGGTNFPATVVRGATIPPSREAQTLHTTVASADSWAPHGRESVASVRIPAHVPVERFTFELDPAYKNDFLRDIVITARPDNAQDTASVETIPGVISRTTLPAETTGFVAGDDLHRLSIDAVLGANLREAATVEIAVENGSNPPLPVQTVQLEMRQRRVCFNADASVHGYILRYGDPALKSPEYDYARLFSASRAPAIAKLGAEEKNKAFRSRTDERPYSQRHPELLWVAFIAAIAGFGTLAMRSAKRRH